MSKTSRSIFDAPPQPLSTQSEQPLARRFSRSASSLALQTIGQIGESERVTDLDPSLVDPSPFADRLAFEGSDPEFDELKASIQANGQSSPILVRIHPEEPGRYEVAYGHRRLRACRELGQKVKAVIRALSDEDLVKAQASENAGRADLSFIERCLYARSLQDSQGKTQKAISDLLAIGEGNLSVMLGVAELPRQLLEAIGPARGIGRPRWLSLQKALQASGQDLQALIDGLDEIQDSDQRFKAVFDRLTPKVSDAAVVQPRIIKSGGRVIAQYQGGPRAKVVTSDPRFANWLGSRLADLAREWESVAPEASPSGEKRGRKKL